MLYGQGRGERVVAERGRSEITTRASHIITDGVGPGTANVASAWHGSHPSDELGRAESHTGSARGRGV